MKFFYKSEDEDLKFICSIISKSILMELADETYLVKDNIKYEGDDLVIFLFECVNIKADKALINKFISFRKSPSKSITNNILLNGVNYINLIRLMLKNGSFKDFEFISDMADKYKFRDIVDPDFIIMGLRGGFIKDIIEVENSDALYKETVKFSDNYECTICSGLQKKFDKKDLIENHFLFFFNLKPVKFIGIESCGMICCGNNENNLELINCSDNDYLKLDGHLDIFNSIKTGKFDAKKKNLIKSIQNFYISNHTLFFKNKKCSINNQHVKFKMETGKLS
ncbi:ARC1 [Hepatospora eriocheir]|uniref:ARC1 n=1 Tax=Hepatospora eriocheir TaxID=1081669 RepID=A0A1X0QH90_9MICR|nr:ARC1 [Hepatospora eriocheir]